MDRLPPIPEARWTDRQREEAHAIIAGPRGALIGPFVPLLRSPELLGHAQRMGEYLRYRSALPQALSELAILVTARAWSQAVEWAIHAPIARERGIPESAILAIAEGRPPEGLPAEARVVYDFCHEIHADRAVSDATWAQAITAFGETGVVDLLGICGYYTLLSMVMNAARTPAPASSAPPLAPAPPKAP
ncbi:MAG: carboxymuconolactone decarboxylase family protein [Burkholderiales bacterium]